MTTLSPITKLIEILTGQRDGYAALLRLAERKHQALLKKDLQALDQAVEQEQALIGVVARLENERMRLADELASYLRIPKDQLNMTSVLQRIDPSTRQVLIGLRDEIVSTIERIEALNQIIRPLLEKELRRVNRSLQILGVADSPAQTYGPKAQQLTPQNDRAKANLFDRKI